MRGGGRVGGGGDVEAAAAFVAGLADDAGHPQGPQECAEDEGGDKEHGPETGCGFRVVAHAREIFHHGEGSRTGKLRSQQTPNAKLRTSKVLRCSLLPPFSIPIYQRTMAILPQGVGQRLSYGRFSQNKFGLLVFTQKFPFACRRIPAKLRRMALSAS